MAGLAAAQAQDTEGTSVGGGSLSWTVTYSESTCGNGALVQEWTAGAFQFTYNGTVYPLTGNQAIYYLSGCGSEGPPNGPEPAVLPIALPSNLPNNADQGCSAEFTLASGGAGGASLSCENIIYPAYKVDSILYAPPGNQSSQGYQDTTTNGTTTTIGSTFVYSQQFYFNSGTSWGIAPTIFSLGGGVTTGFSVGSSSSDAFTTTFSNAAGVQTDDSSNTVYNPAAVNATNHNLDTYEIWLNPAVTVESDGSEGQIPVSYTVYPQATAGLSTPEADIIPVVASSMEPSPAGSPVTILNPSGAAGVTTVPLGDLDPQPIGSNPVAYLPGLASICAANSASNPNSLYQQQLAADVALASTNLATPEICTQANQCGCTPKDFATILGLDPMLGYNSAMQTATPYLGTTDPMQLDGSGASVCGEGQPAGYVIPAGSDCRFVMVPYSGTNTPQDLTLNGAESSNYLLSDATSTTLTTGSSSAYDIGFNFHYGILGANGGIQDTWTWTDTQSTGTASGGTNQMTTTLKTSNADCVENNIELYEDTVYHTFLFREPGGGGSGCGSFGAYLSQTATPQTITNLSGGMPWTNLQDWTDTGLPGPTNAASLNGDNPSQQLTASNFGFDIPANAIIEGIEVSTNLNVSSGSVYGGSADTNISGNNEQMNFFYLTPSGYSTYSTAFPAGNWTPASINASDFGISFLLAPNDDIQVYANGLTVTVYYAP